MTNRHHPLLTRIVASAVQISRKAGRILHEVKLSNNIEAFEDDYVTIATEFSQMCITKSLHSLYPRLKIYFNENIKSTLVDEFDDLEQRSDSNVLEIGMNLYQTCPTYKKIEEKDLCIWVDALNGVAEYTTENYIHEVTILIGIAWQGTPIAGIIHQPFYTGEIEDMAAERFVWGICGLGAYNHVNGKIIRIESILNQLYNNMNNRIITARLSSKSLLKNLYNLIKNPNVTIICAGGSGFKTLCLIDGLADCFLYPSQDSKRWETCAPEAILYSIGGRLKSLFRNNYSYLKKYTIDNSQGIIASIFNHDLFLQSLDQAILVQFLNHPEYFLQIIYKSVQQNEQQKQN